MIDQKEIAMQANSISFRTIEDTAKAILAILNQLTDKYESHKSKQGGAYTKKEFINKVYGDKQVHQFLQDDVNFKKIQKDLKKEGVKFAVTNNRDGTANLYIQSQNAKILETALKKRLEEIATNPQKFSKKKTLAERLKKHKQAVKSEIAKMDKSQTKVKSKSKGI